MTDGEAILTILVMACIYMLPAIVASALKNPQSGAIMVLNILFGWTLIGWGIALIWAFVQTKERRN